MTANIDDLHERAVEQDKAIALMSARLDAMEKYPFLSEIKSDLHQIKDILVGTSLSKGLLTRTDTLEDFKDRVKYVGYGIALCIPTVGLFITLVVPKVTVKVSTPPSQTGNIAYIHRV